MMIMLMMMLMMLMMGGGRRGQREEKETRGICHSKRGPNNTGWLGNMWWQWGRPLELCERLEGLF